MKTKASVRRAIDSAVYALAKKRGSCLTERPIFTSAKRAADYLRAREELVRSAVTTPKRNN